MTHEKILSEKRLAKIRALAYYQGLNIRLQHIAADLAKINANIQAWEAKSEGKSECGESEIEQIFRIIYRGILEKEAAEISKITNP